MADNTASISFSDTGTGDTIAALTGSVFVNGDPAATDGPTVLVDTNAEVILSGTQHLAALDVLPGGTARMAEDGASVLTTDALYLSPAGNGLNGGLLDLTDNDLIVHAGTEAERDASLYIRVRFRMILDHAKNCTPSPWRTGVSCSKPSQRKAAAVQKG